MTESKRKLTFQSEGLAYRRAVRLSLIAFFEKSKEDADRLVDSWWKRMADSEGFKTGLFMHWEPLNTAAHLAHVRPPAIGELGEAYAKVIEDSMPKRRPRYKKKVVGESHSPHAA